ncbi:MAG: hypothetical protein COW75_05590, partial [Rhodobacterales bacterium CG18_big_fil_WC_8_21_14_2_50_71_9]
TRGDSASRPSPDPISCRVVRYLKHLDDAQPHTRRRVPSREITHAETRPADAREAAALALAPGALASGALAHGVEGVSLAEGAPLAAFRSAFPAAR